MQKKAQEELRRLMVALVRRGASIRQVAQRFNKSRTMVTRWVKRAAGRRLERVDWSEGKRGNPHPHKTPAHLVRAILDLRYYLEHHSALGECGAAAIRAALLKRVSKAPGLRTIARILAANQVGRAVRVRRPAPPPGWYLSELAAGQAELDSFDFIEGRSIKGSRSLDILTAMSLQGSLAGAWPLPFGATVAATSECLVSHWQQHLLPPFSQFDNDSIFQGSHGHPLHLGRVPHLCLCLGVSVIFAPPHEQGFQNKLESFNGRWQDKVWQRYRHLSLALFMARNTAFLKAHRAKHAVNIAAVTSRRTFPAIIPEIIQPGRVIFLRRPDATGMLQLLGHSLQLPAATAHRLVRCDWHPSTNRLQIFRLFRRDPIYQPQIYTGKLTIHLTTWSSSPR